MAIQGRISVRLSEEEKIGILNAVEKVANRNGISWEIIALFGSRTDMKAQGGDIDLYIRIGSNFSGDLFQFKTELRVALQDFLGDQKIDLLVDDSHSDLGAFGSIVKKQKVDLWTKN